MRMTNERDQAFLAAAVSDAVNLLAFVPSLGTGEVIAFGEGVPVPARMTFSQLPPGRQPRNDVSGRMPEEGGRRPAAPSSARWWSAGAPPP